MRISLGGFSVAPDFYISAVFYGIVTINCALYVPYVGATFLDPVWDNNSLGKQLWFYYCPIFLAFMADIFLTMTVVGDPGIVLKRGSLDDRPSCVVTAPQQLGLVNRGGISPTGGGGGGASSGTASGNVSGSEQHQSSVQSITDAQATDCSPHAMMMAEEHRLKDAYAKQVLAPDSEGEVDAHLCPVCKVHVEMFDHHCAVVGACIGRYNMASFILFLYSAAALCWVGFWPALYRSFLDLSVWDWNKDPSEFVTMPHFCSALVMACGFLGGSYCFWLGSHYFLFAYQGKNSLGLRRKWLKRNWHDVDPLERYGGHPLGGYLRKGVFANVRAVFRDLKYWRLAPVSPVREM